MLSAHIDHVGIGEPINGDRIYNGAMDNGSGSALLLDMARSLKQTHTKLKRSVLLVWVTGEEKGLLGSKYFAEHPTVPAKSMIADINTDMFLPIVPLKVLTVYGLDESDLGDRATQVGDHLNVQHPAGSAAAAQCVHSQRPIQFRSTRRSGGHDRRRRGARLA